ncbi:MAG: DUF1624 domain-containing protein [Planctomycetota bacterium]
MEAVLASSHRIAAIDRMRGIVMVLMATDHAAHVFYAEHVVLDSVVLPWQAPLPALPFLHRWLSHLCAPIFVFLAGTSIALAASRRSDSSLSFDRDLILRGALLVGLDLTFISWIWGSNFEHGRVLQVLSTIGAGMIAMVAFRRLPGRATLVLGGVLAVAGEALAASPLPESVRMTLVTGGFRETFVVLYPMLPWFAVMLLGHGFGRHLTLGRSAASFLIPATAIAWIVWIAVKVGDGYGNMRMTGVHDGPLRWLQTSKYPPSLAFLGLELGIGLAILCALFRDKPRGDRGLLLVLGQTALFFYVLHIAALESAGALFRAVGLDPRGGLLGNTVAAAIVVLAAWPLGIAFRSLRRRHPTSLLRLV